MLPTIVRRKNYQSPNFWDELFNDSYLPKFFSWDTDRNGSSLPAVNVEETDKEYRIDVAAPGLEKEDIKVSVEDGVLTISSEQKSEKEENNDSYIRREFGYSTFCRSFTLPEGTNEEKISAKHKNGVLNVHIPKAEVKVTKAK
ncbi:MAG: Hsp20/alpha crystallin family protein [Bacteroidales bacterium]|jgi:HSP20 family protein